MVDVSQAFKQAVVADSRRTVAKAVVEILDPDVVYGAVNDSGAAPFAIPDQLKDRVMELSHPYATLERNLWALDGSYDILDPGGIQGNQGWASGALSGPDGLFEADPWVEITFSGVSILQACSVIFGSGPNYGPPVEFTVAVMIGETVGWSQRVTGNIEPSRYFTGFTVQNPTGIRITFHRTSIPYRRVRVAEIIAGIYEEWTNDGLVSVAIKQQGDPSCTTLPYGTMSLVMDNTNRRFDPASKDGIFQSLEERQGIKMYIGVRLPNGTDELAPMGVYYQFQGGWRTGSNAMSMNWSMVDIIGLVTARSFVAPSPLPTTLKGWVEAIVSQLGVNFTTRCAVDPAVADTPITVNRAEDIEGLKCGDLLRYACMAAGAWPRASNDTGDLLVEPVGVAGSELTLDNLTAYPSIQANNDLAAINVTIFDGTSPQQVLTVPGTQPSSSSNLNIQNPFIHSQAAAKAAASIILAAYGGNKITTTGRGDASSEIGDLDTVQVNQGTTVQGRRIYQTLNIQNGILNGCQSNFLVAEGAMVKEEAT